MSDLLDYILQRLGEAARHAIVALMLLFAVAVVVMVLPFALVLRSMERLSRGPA